MRPSFAGSAPRGGAAWHVAVRNRAVNKTAAKHLVIAATALLVVTVLVFSGHVDRAAAQTNDPDDGGSLTVEVTDDTTATPTPTPTRSATPTPSRPPSQPATQTPPRSTSSTTSSTTPAGTATVATIADPAAADIALADAEVVDGILAMSGLTTQPSPSILMGNGSLTVDFVVRNLSPAAFDSTAKFWVDNAFGGRIAEIDGIAVNGLAPDETRRVQVRFDDLGQHIVLNVNATLTPPASIDGIDLEPITRNSTVLVPPWFSIALLTAITLAGWLIWRYLRRRDPVAVLVPAAGVAQ